jgi:uncharacterized protein DUF6088
MFVAARPLRSGRRRTFSTSAVATPSTKVLQRLAQAGQLRRIDRGLYDTPRVNPLTKKPAVPDYYRQVIDAVARRDQVRMLVDGMTAANDLGLTTAVPSHS